MEEGLENTIALICCAILGVLGILSNCACAVLILQIKTFKTAFGYLTLFHTTANALLISCYLFWVAPLILWDLYDLFNVNRTIGQITIIAQAASYFSILLLSANRFICLYKPMHYSVLFTTRNTFIYITVTAMISLAYGCVYFHKSCYFVFDKSTLVFMFSSTACGHFLAEFIDFWMSIALLVLACCLDFLTLVKLRLVIYQRNIDTEYGSTACFKNDLRFLAQTVCTTLLFSSTIICFHAISPQLTERFARFCSTTFIWGVNHAGAGMIVIAFNQKIRSNIYRPFRPRVSSVADQRMRNRIALNSKI